MYTWAHTSVGAVTRSVSLHTSYTEILFTPAATPASLNDVAAAAAAPVAAAADSAAFIHMLQLSLNVIGLWTVRFLFCSVSDHLALMSNFLAWIIDVVFGR